MFGSRTKTQSSFEQIAAKTFTWRSSDKSFVYYDREKGERIPLPKGAKLIPLTTTNSISGVRERDHGKATQRFNPVYSNEFTDYKDEIIRVRERDRLDDTNTILFEGVYSPTIKEAIADIPYCKFTKNVYCLLDGEVVKLSLSGASLTPWIEFENDCKQNHITLVDGHYISVGEPEPKVNGAVNFFSPTFELGDISSEENEKADEVAAVVEEKIARNRASSGTADAPTQIQPKTESPEDGAEEGASLDEIPF